MQIITYILVYFVDNKQHCNQLKPNKYEWRISSNA